MVGMIEGTDPNFKMSWSSSALTLILGAFVGQGDSILNGADDNASGTSALLELVESLQKVKVSKDSHFCRFFSRELDFSSKAFTQIDMESGIHDQLRYDLWNPDEPLTIIGMDFH